MIRLKQRLTKEILCTIKEFRFSVASKESVKSFAIEILEKSTFVATMTTAKVNLNLHEWLYMNIYRNLSVHGFTDTVAI